MHSEDTVDVHVSICLLTIQKVISCILTRYQGHLLDLYSWEFRGLGDTKCKSHMDLAKHSFSNNLVGDMEER